MNPAAKSLCPVGDGEHRWLASAWTTEVGDYGRKETSVNHVYCRKCLKQVRLL